ncbi:MAG: hypothetical protein EPN43_07250 [Jatrophihabitans sp.]|nr:MAG: hypothetical protein EPN43_07250 [Jatrophihabitans sp.]
MRIYLPATSSLLHVLLESGSCGVPPLTAFAVTPGLREWYVDDDVEELEYAAMSEAARASLRLIDADAQAAARRVVVALDAEAVTVRDDLDRGVVRLDEPVALARVAAVHADTPDAEATVRAAAASVVAADLGDAEAQDRVDDADGYELAWYASQEIGQLLATM